MWSRCGLEGERLAHGAAVDAVAARQLSDRQPFPLATMPDLLEQLHPRCHPLCDLPLRLRKTRTLGSRSDEGGPKSGRRSGAKLGRRTQVTGSSPVPPIHSLVRTTTKRPAKARVVCYSDRSSKRTGHRTHVSRSAGFGVILAYTGRPGVQSWRVLEDRCGMREMS
jgi:hypothetical protein